MKRSTSIPLFCLTYTVPFAVLEGVVLTQASAAQDVPSPPPVVEVGLRPAPTLEPAPVAAPLPSAPVAKPQKAIAAPPAPVAPPPAPVAPKPQPAPAAAPPAPKPAAPPPPVGAGLKPAPTPKPAVSPPPSQPAPVPAATPAAPTPATEPAIVPSPAIAPEPVASPEPAVDIPPIPEEPANIPNLETAPTPETDPTPELQTTVQPSVTPEEIEATVRTAEQEQQQDLDDSVVPAWMEVSFWSDRLLEETMAEFTLEQRWEMRRLERELEQAAVEQEAIALTEALPPAPLQQEGERASDSGENQNLVAPALDAPNPGTEVGCRGRFQTCPYEGDEQNEVKTPEAQTLVKITPPKPTPKPLPPTVEDLSEPGLIRVEGVVATTTVRFTRPANSESAIEHQNTQAAIAHFNPDLFEPRQFSFWSTAARNLPQPDSSLSPWQPAGVVDRPPSVAIASHLNLERHKAKTKQLPPPDRLETVVTVQLPQTPAPETTAQIPEFIPATSVRILSPQPGESESTVNLIVQYGVGNEVTVTINTEPLSDSVATISEADEINQIVTQIWYGLQLETGENAIAVIPENGETKTLNLTVASPSEDLIVEVFPVGNPQVPADGRSTIPIEGVISSAGGQGWETTTTVTLTTTAGEFIGADYDEDAGGFQVQAVNGRFQALLRSTLDAQKVRIRAAIANPQERDDTSIQAYRPHIEAFTEVQYTTHLRPSLVSGVAHVRWGPRGTDYWGSRSDFLDPNEMEGTEINPDVSLFATGSWGEWLFTGAFNSDRPLNKTCDGVTRLFRGPQHCDQAYPVYGDSSTVDYLTPSTDQVYVRLERTSDVPGAEPDYAMWGDYRTSEIARESQAFSAVNRQLHGFKGNYNWDNLQFTALYSPDTQGFQRDTIAPDGTSGYYFLSQRLVIAGSESVFIEQESLERPGLVTERVALSRGADYEIDYDRGTLLFRRPIQRLETDGFGTNTVQQIVVTYQFDGANNSDTNIYSGRLQYNFSHDLSNPSWAGMTYLFEDQGDREYELYAADLQMPWGSNGAIVAEYAHSTVSVLGNDSTGAAYRLKINKQISAAVSINGYYLSVEEGFYNEASASFRPGQTRYGANLTAALDDTTNVTASYDHEKNFGTAPRSITDPLDLFDSTSVNITEGPINNDLTTMRVGIQKKLGKSRLAVEFVNRSREDHVGNTFDSNTSQLVTNFTVALAEALSFRAKNEINLGDGDVSYPNRTTLGLNWAVTPGVDIRLAHQFQNGSLFGDNSITRLDTIASTALGEDTDLTSRYSILGGINGMMGQGAVGLNHRWLVTPGLRVNIGYERVLNNIFGSNGAGDRFGQPVVLGQRAASLGFFGGESYSVAAEYTANPDWQASARFERRNSSYGTNTVWGAAASGKISPALTTLFRYEQASSANGLLEALGDTISAKLGLAYRNPSDDRFNALLSYEYRKNPAAIPQTLLIGSGTQSEDHTLAMEMIYAPDWRWEFYGKYATRYSRTDLASNFSNSSQIHLGQLRATYRLGYRFDLAVEGRSITQPSENFTELGSAVELGYYLTPDLRLGIGYSFGSVNDGGFTGYRSASGAYLGLTFKVNELLGGFGRQRVAPPQQEESLVSQRES